MKNEPSSFIKLLTVLAIVGNLVFVLWIFYNGVNEGFQGTIVEKTSYITIMGLLLVNAFLLLRKNKQG